MKLHQLEYRDIARHTNVRGEQSPSAKLTEKKVKEIFFADGPRKDIAERYGVNTSTVTSIKRKVTWIHVTRKLTW